MSAEGTRSYKDEGMPTPLGGANRELRREERNFSSSKLLERLEQEHKDLQQRIANISNEILLLNTSLSEGGKHIMQAESPKLRELALNLGRETRAKISAREKEQAGLEKALEDVSQQIRQEGGNPSSHTLQ